MRIDLRPLGVEVRAAGVPDQERVAGEHPHDVLRAAAHQALDGRYARCSCRRDGMLAVAVRTRAAAPSTTAASTSAGVRIRPSRMYRANDSSRYTTMTMPVCAATPVTAMSPTQRSDRASRGPRIAVHRQIACEGARATR